MNIFDLSSWTERFVRGNDQVSYEKTVEQNSDTASSKRSDKPENEHATGIGLVLVKEESTAAYDTVVSELLSGGSALLSGLVLVRL